MNLSALPRGIPVTLSLIVLNALAFLAQQATRGDVDQWGVLFGPAVEAGQWWRLLSSGFLHGSLFHIGFNMFLLYALGSQLERGIGSARFALLYFGALFGGALTVMMFDWDQPTLGASGAVLGIAGGFAVALWAQGNDPRQSPIFGLVLLNLGLPLLIPGISFWGHFGGVAAGALMAGLLIWWPTKNSNASKRMTLLNGTGAMALLAFCSVMAARLGSG
ncbi:MAG: rhomboid family intramembrane serine protease [Granulosicoccus sp.]